MAQTPTGTAYAVATAYAAAKGVTAISNAAEAVLTVVGHGYQAGDIVEVTSGWGRLTKRHCRVKASLTADTFSLEAFDTTNTAVYPAGQGVGSVRKVTTFTPFNQVLTSGSSGGDPKVVNYRYQEADVDFQLNDGFNGVNYNFDIDADSLGSAGYKALRDLTDVASDTCLRMQLRSGSVIYQAGVAALNEAVQLQDGQVNRVKLTFNGNNRPTRY